MRVSTVVRAVLLLAYVVVAGYYFYKRSQESLDVYWASYGRFVLFLEVLVASAVLLYAATLTRRVKLKPPKKPVVGIETVRVFIHCSCQPLESVKAAVVAALSAACPADISKHVYLLDDAPDERRRVWVQSMTGATRGCLHYKTRSRAAVEVNPRSANLNATLRALYGDLGSDVGRGACNSELVAVFDADQACKADFFTRTLEAMGDAAMLATPQRAHSMIAEQDLFSQGTVQWYEYILAGMSAWGCVNCANTNFLIKADVLRAVGYFREEESGDFGLSVELARRGYECKYLQEYLSIGEASGTPKSFFEEKSMWARSHLQVFFGKSNPMFAKGLPFKAKLFYSMTNWSMLVTAITTPFSILIPLLILWYGIFPIDITREFAVILVAYYVTMILTVYYSDSYSDTYNFWLGWVSNQIFWYTYLKSIVRVILGKVLGKHISFNSSNNVGKNISPSGSLSVKATTDAPVQRTPSGNHVILNGGGSTQKDDVGCGTSRIACDFWGCGSDAFVLLAVFLLSLGTAIYGGFWMIGQTWRDWKAVQMVAVFWCLQNAIPPYLLFHYILFRKKLLNRAAILGGLVMLATTVVSFVIMILYSKRVYDYGEIIDMSILFFEAQRSGKLPPDNRIPWRGDAALLDQTEDGRSLVGGYFDAGDTIKFGLPMATSMSLLAWGLIEFPKGYTDTKRMHEALAWGTDYFLKCHTGENEFYAQVGTGGEEHGTWERPEVMLKEKVRIGLKVNATLPGSDVVGSTAAALAAASMVFKKSRPAYSEELLKHARELYEFGNTYRGKYSESIADAGVFYPSTDYADDLSWGAIWLYEATRERRYLEESAAHLDTILDRLEGNPSPLFDWDSLSQGAALLLFRETHDMKYQKVLDRHAEEWLELIDRTPRGLVWPMQAGVLRQVANTALLFLIQAKDEKARGIPLKQRGVYECWSREQIRYMLGEGGRSFVVGYGHNYPKRVHHRGATCPVTGSCSWDKYRSSAPNHNVLIGGLVGGPDKRDVYADDRVNFKQSEVAIDFSAGFTGALAGLRHIQDSRGLGMCLQGSGISKRFRVVGSTDPAS